MVTLYRINAFDGNYDFLFTFKNTGNQAVKNRLVIKKNLDNSIVYEETLITNHLEHNVPAGSLVNGETYNAQVFLYDINDEELPPSNEIIFKTFTTPFWSFSNLEPNQTIRNSYYQLLLEYYQVEGELLDSYQIELYDSLNSLIYKTSVLYDTSSLSVNLSNLDDDRQYYVVGLGRTLNGMELSTGKIPISVDYLKPSLFSLVELTNLPYEGSIKIAYNVVIVNGITNHEPVFIDNEKIDLQQSGHKVEFSEGFNLEKDGIIQLIGQNFNDYSIIMELESQSGRKLKLKYMRGKFASQVTEKAYFLLQVDSLNYMIYSNYIDIPQEDDILHIWIKKINGIYSLICEKL